MPAASILIEDNEVPASPAAMENDFAELSVKVPYEAPLFVIPVEADVTVLVTTTILRPSAADKLTPKASVPPSVAITPVRPLMALIAVIVAERLTVPSEVVENVAVATPLIEMVPDDAAAVIIEPFNWFALAVAVTPVKLEIALIAATFAIELLALPVEEAKSLVEREAPTTAPLILKSPAANAVAPPEEVDA